MNFSAILGIMAAFAVFFGAIFSATNNVNIFINGHAFLIVVGGTVAAALISFPISQLWRIQKVVFRKVIGKYGASSYVIIHEIVKLAEWHREDPNLVRDKLNSVSYPFLREAMALYLDGGVPAEKIDSILKKRAEVIFLKYESEAHLFRSISRFPPAFGLLGAVMGMITLLQGLGSPDSFKQIGPAMAMAMVATMYGIAIANLVLIPLAENLSKLNKEEFLNRSIVIDGVKLIRSGDHPLIVEESLNSYLPPGERQEKKAKAA